MNHVYGYIRVSTREQKEDRQLIAMQEMAVKKKNIYMDKQSGKDFQRPQYQKLLKKNQKGRPAVHKKHRPPGPQLSGNH